MVESLHRLIVFYPPCLTIQRFNNSTIQDSPMKVIILAAGYATRLYLLTLTQPKPLLPVACKPMVEHVLDNLAPITEIDRVYVLTNAKFADHFQKWSDNYRATKSKFDFTVV